MSVKLQNSGTKVEFKEIGVLYTYHLFAWDANLQSICLAATCYYSEYSTSYISVMTDGNWTNYFKALKPGTYFLMVASAGNAFFQSNGAYPIILTTKTASDTYPSSIIDFRTSAHIFYFVL